jgi:hypothetical protein
MVVLVAPPKIFTFFLLEREREKRERERERKIKSAI